VSLRRGFFVVLTLPWVERFLQLRRSNVRSTVEGAAIMSCHPVTRRIFTTLSLGAVTVLLAGSTVAAAQPQPPQSPDSPPSLAGGDPPGRVARISFLSGATSLRPAAVDEWTNATVNYPLTVGDHLWTDRGARAELDLGTLVVRVAPLTEFSILALDDHNAQLRVTAGSVAIRVREHGDDEELEVDTPSGAADLLVPGTYRIDVNDSGDGSTVTVRRGEAEVTTAEATYPVREATAFALQGTVTPTHTELTAAPTDAFEDWAMARDRRADSAQSLQYVSRGEIGYADLDDNGAWRQVPAYGAVWVPRVAADWVPYRYGHWVYIQPWGWTWIDDAPWGFAPSHYGRWVYLPPAGAVVGSWAWVPGRVVARPVYAPALVAFVGGSNWSVGVAAGATPVGWFPLGPREPFVPAYRVSPTYVHAVNITQVNVTTVNGAGGNVANVTYVNREVPRAVTVVSRETFVQARPVATGLVAVPREQLRGAAVIGGGVAFAPERVSIVGRAGTVRVAAPPAVVVDRRVVVRRMPPPVAARTPAPTRVPPPAVANADLASRHQRERADFESRMTNERAQLNARHQQEMHAAANQHQRQQLQAQHQHEVQALQARQTNDRQALQKRQAAERQQQPHEHK
jgi:hypothetical protein